MGKIRYSAEIPRGYGNFRKTRLPLGNLFALDQGVIYLEQFAGEPVEILINNKLIALGEVHWQRPVWGKDNPANFCPLRGGSGRIFRLEKQEMDHGTGIYRYFSGGGSEYLQILNRCALRLEEKPTDRESLGGLPVVHSLKGMAGTMGYQNIMKITHCLENILEELQAGAIVPNPSTMDIIFEG